MSSTGKPPARKPRAKAEVVPAKPSLSQLKRTANQEHARAFAAGKEMLEHALLAGEALIAAKDEVEKHGEWLPWLKENFEASEDTAENYMRLARNSEHVRNLPIEEASLRGALNSIRALRPKAKPKRKKSVGV
jgi:hypothetical protein